MVGSRHGRRPNPTPNPNLNPNPNANPHPDPYPDPKRARNGPETRLRRFRFSIYYSELRTMIYLLTLVVTVKFLDVSWKFPPDHSVNTTRTEFEDKSTPISDRCR